MAPEHWHVMFHSFALRRTIHRDDLGNNISLGPYTVALLVRLSFLGRGRHFNHMAKAMVLPQGQRMAFPMYLYRYY